jgi:hypothetical protein
VVTLLSFHRLPDGDLVAFFSSVCIRQKGIDNDAKGSTKDYLAESETTSTSKTLGADHSGLSNGSLFGSGIDFHPRGIVLGHDS